VNNMSELTKEQINERMALIMGWHKEQCNCGSCNVWYWVDSSGEQVMYGLDWNPPKDLNQANMVLTHWLEGHLDYTPELGVNWEGDDCYLLLNDVFTDAYFVSTAKKLCSHVSST